MMIKTRTSDVAALTEIIKQNHPYEVPEVISVEITQGKSPPPPRSKVNLETMEWWEKSELTPSVMLLLLLFVCFHHTTLLQAILPTCSGLQIAQKKCERRRRRMANMCVPNTDTHLPVTFVDGPWLGPLRLPSGCGILVLCGCKRSPVCQEF